MEEDCRLGPVVSESQYNKVMGLKMRNASCDKNQGAVKQGATLLTGGSRPPMMPSGYYVQPTVFTDVDQNMTIWKEEVFGPVLACRTFK
eukprot:scaffold101597_cov45-Prasinocladus_malaysianus.AAC.1